MSCFPLLSGSDLSASKLPKTMNSEQPLSQPGATAENLVQAQPNNACAFPIAAIAASAGGLEAFTELLRHLPTDTGLAFVLIQHLDPTHKSLLSEILAKVTVMPVCEVCDGMTIEPNRVYIIAPNTKMTLAQGVFQLRPREKVQGKYMPADAFFISLAAEHEGNAIAVVLSGTDGDGAIGLEAIKAAGGITFAQCEATAKFSGMPNTAVATGHVDFILPPQKIAEELAAISRHPYIRHLPRAAPFEAADRPLDPDGAARPALLALLRTAIGVDFTHYKRPTLERRIQRRMVLYKLERLEDYVRYLQQHPTEVQALYQDILISVTSFFRDPEAFAALKEKVFPQIVQGQSAESPIRIWVPGCATGEEVYSIAIGLLEFLAERAINPPIQIFGTDISDSALNTARTGRYQKKLLAGVSPERLRRFFVLVEDGYQISERVRKLCVFAKQNLISEPPFSNLDLISCRNVLIYLAAPLQKRVLPLFHYSLKSTGFLLLGSAESPGESSDLFVAVDKKQRIYARTSVSPRPSFDFAPSRAPVALPQREQRPNENVGRGLDVRQQADQIVLHRYAPIGVLIDDGLDILQFRGETNAYLRPAPGEPSFNLLKMVRPGLLSELRTAIYQAKRQDTPVQKARLRVEGNETLGEVRIEVIPFKALPAEERYFLVLFELMPLGKRDAEMGREEDTGQTELSAFEVARLRQELADTKQELADTQMSLQAIIEEENAINQNLTTANEEILSSNEELQSTNEELQTAKEEIQSANEELKTTNEELQSRNLEARQANNDLMNLLTNVNLPILMLANDLTIRRFTPRAQSFFHLIPGDSGRPFSDLRPNLDAPDLETWIVEVMDTLIAQEHEVQDWEGHWHRLQIRLYRTMDNQIDGVVLVLIDIDALKQGAALLEAARHYAENIVETVRHPLVVLDADLRVKTANRSFYQMFQVSPAQTEQQLLFELGNGQWNIPQLRSHLEKLLPQSLQIQDFEIEHNFEQIGMKTLLLNAREVLPVNDRQMILLVIEDITERKQAETVQQERAQELNALNTALFQTTHLLQKHNQELDQFTYIVSHDLKAPLRGIANLSQWLADDLVGLLPEPNQQQIRLLQERVHRMEALIDGLLEYSRVGRTTSVAETVDVAELLADVIDLLAPPPTFRLEIAPGMPTLTTDRLPLSQVFANLIGNAIKHHVRAAGRVKISVEDLGDCYQFAVSDDGTGIAPEHHEQIFTIFQTLRASDNQENTGIGLAIVKRLVEKQGGTISLESQVGQGTTFRFTWTKQLR